MKICSIGPCYLNNKIIMLKRVFIIWLHKKNDYTSTATYQELTNYLCTKLLLVGHPVYLYKAAACGTPCIHVQSCCLWDTLCTCTKLLLVGHPVYMYKAVACGTPCIHVHVTCSHVTTIPHTRKVKLQSNSFLWVFLAIAID